jgi:hypothetical protein
MKLIMQLSLRSSTLSLLDAIVFLNTLFSNTVSTCSSLNVTEQVSYRCKEKKNFNSLYFNLYIFG